LGPRGVTARVLAEGEVAVEQAMLLGRHLHRAETLLAEQLVDGARVRAALEIADGVDPRAFDFEGADADVRGSRSAQRHQLMGVDRQVVGRERGRRI